MPPTFQTGALSLREMSRFLQRFARKALHKVRQYPFSIEKFLPYNNWYG
jgi:hypothetical protein